MEREEGRAHLLEFGVASAETISLTRDDGKDGSLRRARKGRRCRFLQAPNTEISTTPAAHESKKKYLLAKVESRQRILASRRRVGAAPTPIGSRRVDPQKVVLQSVVQGRLLLKPRLHAVQIRREHAVSRRELLVSDLHPSTSGKHEGREGRRTHAQSRQLVLEFPVLGHEERLERFPAMLVRLVGVRIWHAHQLVRDRVVLCPVAHSRKLDVLPTSNLISTT